MKGRIIIFLALLLVSCSKQGRDEQWAADVPQPIVFQSLMSVREEEREDPKSTISTWNREELMVFGIHRRNGNPDLSSSGRYIDGADGNAPVGATGLITLNNPSTGLPYFYPLQGTLDFFACYLGKRADNEGAKVPGDLFEDSLVKKINEKYISLSDMTLGFTITVDGTQDIMTAYADRDADCRSASNPGSYIISPDEAYGSQSARMGVYPKLKFSHVLTRLSFSAKAMTEGLTVTDVRAAGRNSARLMPVRPNPSTRSSFEYLPGGDQGSLAVEGIRYPVPLSTTSAKDIGETMMIPGGSSCMVYLDLKQLGIDEVATTSVSVDLTTIESGMTFQEGMWYDIVLSVYGAQRVEFAVAMNPWRSGYGEFDIDNDK